MRIALFVEFAERLIGLRSMDEGPLSRELHTRIVEIVRAKHGEAREVESMFDRPANAPNL